ncbi:hypothetical protein AB3M83_06985 [Microbacterium sp. 179-B 1A2 NHS]|uniref:hypothetical protein n=1 Tax=Microbacterium sp. 179-B 1A2 NHS TaxID=3142383 RepID=UPI0039A2A03B
MSDADAKPSQAEGEDPSRPGSGDGAEETGHPSQAEGEDTDDDDHTGGQDVEDPEDRGAPVAESHVVVSDHDGRTRVDIADDAQMRPGPGPGQPDADLG